jgi:hypothetical protein
VYDRLLELRPSPVVALNRAIALAQVEGPDAGLAAIRAIPGSERLEEYRQGCYQRLFQSGACYEERQHPHDDEGGNPTQSRRPCQRRGPTPDREADRADLGQSGEQTETGVDQSAGDTGDCHHEQERVVRARTPPSQRKAGRCRRQVMLALGNSEPSEAGRYRGQCGGAGQ